MIKDYSVRVCCEYAAEHYHRVIQTDVLDDSVTCPTHTQATVRDFVIEEISNCVPTASANLLQITSNVGTAIIDDTYDVTPDESLTKYVKISVARDDTSGDLEILAFEKTSGEYGNSPAGKTVVQEISEFYVVASGTELVGV